MEEIQVNHIPGSTSVEFTGGSQAEAMKTFSATSNGRQKKKPLKSTGRKGLKKGRRICFSHTCQVKDIMFCYKRNGGVIYNGNELEAEEKTQKAR
jgi:hypothetical protein